MDRDRGPCQLSRKNSTMAQPEKGADCPVGTGLEGGGGDHDEYSMALLLDSLTMHKALTFSPMQHQCNESLARSSWPAH